MVPSHHQHAGATREGPQKRLPPAASLLVSEEVARLPQRKVVTIPVEEPSGQWTMRKLEEVAALGGGAFQPPADRQPSFLLLSAPPDQNEGMTLLVLSMAPSGANCRGPTQTTTKNRGY